METDDLWPCWLWSQMRIIKIYLRSVRLKFKTFPCPSRQWVLYVKGRGVQFSWNASFVQVLEMLMYETLRYWCKHIQLYFLLISMSNVTYELWRCLKIWKVAMVAIYHNSLINYKSFHKIHCKLFLKSCFSLFSFFLSNHRNA